MANAINAIARADAEVKGEAVDKSYALERMVLAVSTGRA
jgi:DNA polymerase III delta subunit